MRFGDFLSGLRDVVPGVAKSEGEDPKQVMDGMAADFLVAERDVEFAKSNAVRDRREAEYHGAAKRGIMRVSGLTDREYDRIRGTDPAAFEKLQSEYLSTI